MQPAHDTIAAIATPPGTGGVSIIRISGSEALAIAARVSGTTPAPRRATLAHIRDARGDTLDQALLLYYPAPHSYTGEDTLEIQGHGGIAVTQAVLAAVLDAGARLAEPGEYTRRAYLNNKIDLAQAEAIADLINARSQAAVKAANRSLQGDFSRQIETLAADLLALRIYIEAALDFPEEEIDFLREGDIAVRLQGWGERLRTLLAQSTQGRLMNDGINLVIAGKPNAGKSSLLNALVGEERAIVTAQAGTTRDIVRETILIHGMPVNILDTAGLREAEDLVEQEGIRRTRHALSQADLILLLRDGSALDDAADDELPANIPQLLAYNKADQTPPAVQAQHADGLWISAKTGAGIDALRDAIACAVGRDSREESPYIARERHLRALHQAERHYQDALAQLHSSQNGELIAEDLRLAHEALGSITGAVSSDDLLGHIFSSFCIGK
ncbi:tRNA uridine-5-carboxymethylaminomethyl(34) synthesis GTPase MnmE [Cardiobacterium hominis]|uniref:tRNA uridine-5-carboxymethylaminomethyl(34) synthesis GTPase MnmE n=1 Tax=Cardiobacterium hominis TaxID=2718 RepID=UPI0028D550EE|nr:tRNA uridine-5-carboxymethylaminomethyl(34) synthesis GTPase MnmE [Cardiobacterium hominis]